MADKAAQTLVRHGIGQMVTRMGSNLVCKENSDCLLKRRQTKAGILAQRDHSGRSGSSAIGHGCGAKADAVQKVMKPGIRSQVVKLGIPVHPDETRVMRLEGS